MANNKEPINYTNGNQRDKLVDAIIEKNAKQIDAEKKAVKEIENAELELDAKKQKNLSDKRANDDTTRLQYDKQKFEALVDQNHFDKKDFAKTLKQMSLGFYRFRIEK